MCRYMFIVAHHVRILHTSNTMSDTNVIMGYYINMCTVIRMLLNYLLLCWLVSIHTSQAYYLTITFEMR